MNSTIKVELKKLGSEVEILNDNSIKINPLTSKNEQPTTNNQQPATIKTYDDHRMAMAFAAFALKLDSLIIEQPDVVKKSYPNFWNDLKSVGFVVEEI